MNKQSLFFFFSNSFSVISKEDWDRKIADDASLDFRARRAGAGAVPCVVVVVRVAGPVTRGWLQQTEGPRADRVDVNIFNQKRT